MEQLDMRATSSLARSLSLFQSHSLSRALSISYTFALHRVTAGDWALICALSCTLIIIGINHGVRYSRWEEETLACFPLEVVKKDSSCVKRNPS